MAAIAPENESIKRDNPYAGKVGCCGDPEALPNQPGCCEPGIFFHTGTAHYPAHDGMLDAGAVSGIYQDPDCKCCTTDIRAVPAVGFLCVTQFCGPCPWACYCAPFNCAPSINCNGAHVCSPEGKGSKTTCSCGGCGYGGPKAAPCLPDPLSLAGTWFCVPGPCLCFDWHNVDTMITSVGGCFCPQVHRKIKQGKIIC